MLCGRAARRGRLGFGRGWAPAGIPGCQAAAEHGLDHHQQPRLPSAPSSLGSLNIVAQGQGPGRQGLHCEAKTLTRPWVSNKHGRMGTLSSLEVPIREGILYLQCSFWGRAGIARMPHIHRVLPLGWASHAPDVVVQQSAIQCFLFRAPRLRRAASWHPGQRWSPVKHVGTAAKFLCEGHSIPVPPRPATSRDRVASSGSIKRSEPLACPDQLEGSRHAVDLSTQCREDTRVWTSLGLLAPPKTLGAHSPKRDHVVRAERKTGCCQVLGSAETQACMVRGCRSRGRSNPAQLFAQGE